MIDFSNARPRSLMRERQVSTLAVRWMTRSGFGSALGERRPDLLVEPHLLVAERQVREDLVLRERVVGDDELLEEVHLRDLLLLAVAREQEVDLRLEGRPLPPLVEVGEERVLDVLEDLRAGEALREEPGERGLPDADRSLDRDVPEGKLLGAEGAPTGARGYRRRTSAAPRTKTATESQPFAVKKAASTRERSPGRDERGAASRGRARPRRPPPRRATRPRPRGRRRRGGRASPRGRGGRSGAPARRRSAPGWSGAPRPGRTPRPGGCR